MYNNIIVLLRGYKRSLYFFDSFSAAALFEENSYMQISAEQAHG